MTFNYSFTIDAIMLLAVISRVGAFTFSFTFYNSNQISKTHQALFVFAISLLLLPTLPKNWMSVDLLNNLDMWKLTFILMSEMLLGLTISLLVMIFTEIFLFAGFILDRDIGFAMAQVVDPGGGNSSTVLAGILLQIFTVMLLITDTHLDVIRIAAISLETLGPGAFIISGDIAEIMVEASSKIFYMGIQIAFPVFAVILMTNVGMGLMARVGEDFPVLMLSFPIRILLGFLILGSLFPIIVEASKIVASDIIDYLAYFANIAMLF